MVEKRFVICKNKKNACQASACRCRNAAFLRSRWKCRLRILEKKFGDHQLVLLTKEDFVKMKIPECL